MRTLFFLESKGILHSKTKNICTIIKAPPSTLGSALHLSSAFNHMITYFPGVVTRSAAKRCWAKAINLSLTKTTVSRKYLTICLLHRF